MVTTDDAALAAQLRSLANQGRSDSGDWLEHDKLGFNYRMDELSAAVGLAQTERLDEILAARAAVAARYDELLAGDRRRRRSPRRRADGDVRSWFVYVVRLDAEHRPQRRDGRAAGARRRLQAVPAGGAPAAVLPQPRAPAGRVPDRRGHRALDARAAVPHAARAPTIRPTSPPASPTCSTEPLLASRSRSRSSSRRRSRATSWRPPRVGASPPGSSTRPRARPRPTPRRAGAPTAS